MTEDFRMEDSPMCSLDMKNKVCTTHKCPLEELRISTSKWSYIKSKKCYGNVKGKSSRWICRQRKTSQTFYRKRPKTSSKLPSEQCTELGRVETSENLSNQGIIRTSFGDSLDENTACTERLEGLG